MLSRRIFKKVKTAQKLRKKGWPKTIGKKLKLLEKNPFPGNPPFSPFWEYGFFFYEKKNLQILNSLTGP